MLVLAAVPAATQDKPASGVSGQPAAKKPADKKSAAKKSDPAKQADAKADPKDYLRAYSYKQEMPLHVRAYFAIAAIESALKDRKPAAAGDPSAPQGKAKSDAAKRDKAKRDAASPPQSKRDGRLHAV